MRAFSYDQPTRITIAEGAVGSLPEAVPEGARVLLVFGGGSSKSNGVAEQVRSALARWDIKEHWGVGSNPTLSDVAAILEAAQDRDFLLAVGGGSVIDATKFAAAALRAEVDPAVLLARGVRVANPVPVGVVVTLAGTGAEANGIAAITDADRDVKLVYVNPAIRPAFALLDPSFLLTVPRAQLASCVVDAFVHTLEQYATQDAGAPLQERLSEAILSTLLELAEPLLAEESSYDVRANFMWAATLAQGGLLASGVPEDWATHFIGHELTSHWGVPHGRSLALVLPLVYQLRLADKEARLAQLATRVFGVSTGSEAVLARAALDSICAFFERIGVPTDIRSLGLRPDDAAIVVAGLKKARRVRLGEKLNISLKEVEAMLRSALE